MMYIDIYVTDHRTNRITLKQSIFWSIIWISIALIFNLAIVLFMEDGFNLGMQFFSAYIVEKSLSVDNLFVFLMIFKVMNISEANQPHILKWGIISAIVMRIIFIIAGVALMHLFHPIIYIFSILLFYASYHIAFGEEQTINTETSKILLFFKRVFHYQPDYKGKKFFWMKNKLLYITPLFLTLALIEISDLMFAIDSIPAVLAISTDPFIAITSNIFAILGLRALYFVVAGITEKFYLLKYGVALILAFIGVKMGLTDIYPIPTLASLIFISISLSLSIILSLIIKKK